MWVFYTRIVYDVLRQHNAFVWAVQLLSPLHVLLIIMRLGWTYAARYIRQCVCVQTATAAQCDNKVQAIQSLQASLIVLYSNVYGFAKMRCSRVIFVFLNEVQPRVSVGFQSRFLGLQFVDLQNNASFSSYLCLLGMPLQPFRTVQSKTCPCSAATLSSQLCTRTLQLLVGAKVRKELQSCTVSAAAINFMDLNFL